MGGEIPFRTRGLYPGALCFNRKISSPQGLKSLIPTGLHFRHGPPSEVADLSGYDPADPTRPTEESLDSWPWKVKISLQQYKDLAWGPPPIVTTNFEYEIEASFLDESSCPTSSALSLNGRFNDIEVGPNAFNDDIFSFNKGGERVGGDGVAYTRDNFSGEKEKKFQKRARLLPEVRVFAVYDFDPSRSIGIPAPIGPGENPGTATASIEIGGLDYVGYNIDFWYAQFRDDGDIDVYFDCYFYSDYFNPECDLDYIDGTVESWGPVKPTEEQLNWYSPQDYYEYAIYNIQFTVLGSVFTVWYLSTVFAGLIAGNPFTSFDFNYNAVAST